MDGTWFEELSGVAFSRSRLSYGVFARAGERARVGARVGEVVLDLAAALGDDIFDAPSMKGFLARGRAGWACTASEIEAAVSAPDGRDELHRFLVGVGEVEVMLPIEVADFVDFYSSLEHATNAGRILRPGHEPLRPNWRQMPIGYHGRAATVVVSGTPGVRPAGQLAPCDSGGPALRPTEQLDFEAEVGFVVGRRRASASRYRSRPSATTSSASCSSSTGARGTSRRGSTCRSGRSRRRASALRSRRGSLAPFLEMTHEQWEFVIGVNLWGVVHGLQAFLPGMVERDEGHVVNTASVAGLVVAPGAANYSATKHAVVGLSEALFRELAAAGSNVGISVLCLAAVDTDILRAERNWPAHLGPAPEARQVADGEIQGLKQADEVAAEVFQAIADRQFWILTHAEQFADALRGRAEGMIAGRNPDDSSVDPNFRNAHGSLAPQ